MLCRMITDVPGVRVGHWTDPVARTGIFSAPAFQFLVIAFEVFLGFWLLSGLKPIGAWLTVLVAFTGFAAVSFYLIERPGRGREGRPACPPTAWA